MMAAYRQAVAFLESLPDLEPRRPRRRAGEEGMARLGELMALLDHPERGRRILHIGGTSGKGSTVGLLHHMYTAADAPVVSFTSPHLTTTLERIQLRDGFVPVETFVAAVDAVRHAALQMHLRSPYGAPGYFDALLAVCLHAARALEADPLILEVGLGGQLDATNIIPPPLVAAVTDVGLDHTEILGDTLEAIAADKGGIFKPGAAALTGTRAAGPLGALTTRAAEAGVPLRRLGEDFDLRLDGGTWRFTDRYGALDGLPAPRPGDHHRRNTALALAVAREARARGLPLSDAAMIRGLARTFVAGRFEVVPGAPTVVLDVAHNPDKLRAFREAFSTRFGSDAVLLFSAAQDKDLAGMLQALAGAFRCLVISRPLSPFRAFHTPREILAAAAGRFPEVVVTLDPTEGLARAKTLAGPSGVIAVTGSTFLVGQVRGELQPEAEILVAGRLTPIGSEPT